MSLVKTIEKSTFTSEEIAEAIETLRVMSRELPAGAVSKMTDKRGSLVVPAELLRQLGKKPGDKVSVSPSKKGKALLVFPSVYDEQTQYTVNSSGNVRITRSKLSKITQHKTGQRFTIENRNKVLVIE